MQVSNYKGIGMQEGNESSVRKVNKKVSNSKMSKNQKVPTNSNFTPENFSESPQNVRLDTSESDEESVSEESFPQDQDDISTEEFSGEDEDENVSDLSGEDQDNSDESSGEDQDNSDDDSDATADEERQSGPAKKFLLDVDDEHPQYSKQARIDAILEAAAASKDKKANPVLRSAATALDEAAQTITRMRSDASPRDKNHLSRTLIEACTDNDVSAVRRLLVEGNNLNEATDDGDSLLSLACSAGYYELAQVLLAMSAQVEDRGQKNDCTPLMEAASAGHIEIIELLIRHGADVNAQSSTGNTPLMYACAGGHVEAVKVLLAQGANVEDHNENGHTPLMEAASAGHVAVAKILLEHGAGINTHSNEFKESALTLACYKGHLDMVRYLLEAGADQEHKTDEMHTALMEASMDGHVEVARLLLDSGAQVNMPTDSFESPLTLAACGGHVDLAMLLIERGANIEEVNDEGYTPLMEAAREGHEEMVSLLLTQGANINAQTEETQETALTLACCGGFLEVADYLIKHGADIELGASTPLMEAAQEGHLELVKFLLDNKADVHAQTQTGDTALTYACENGHTDVAEVLLYFGAELEHLSEGGRTPLMKACRAGHICTVKFLIQKGADVNRQTTNNDHTPLSLACAGGHQQVVELLLAHGADPYHKLKDNSTMLIEAAKGGHTGVVQLLLDYPTSIPPPQQQSLYLPSPMPPQQGTQLNMTQIKQQQLKILQQQQQQHQIIAQQQQFLVAPPGLHDVAEVIRLQEPPGIFQSQADMIQNQNFIIDPNVMTQQSPESSLMTQMKLLQSTGFKDGLAYGLTKGQSAVNQMINQQNTNNMNVMQCQNQQQPPQQPIVTNTNNLCMPSSSNKQKNISRKKCSSSAVSYNDSQSIGANELKGSIGEDDSVTYIKSSLDKLDNTLQKNIQFINDSGPPPTLLPSGTYVDITTAAQGKAVNFVSQNNHHQQAQLQPVNKTTQITAKSEVSQTTAISDRPKVKAKNTRKLQQQQQQQLQQSQQQPQSGSIGIPVSPADIKPPQVVSAVPPPLGKPESDIQQTITKSETLQEVPQQLTDVAASLQPITVDQNEKVAPSENSNRTCSLVDFEAFQKMPLNNLSNRSAHWNPKVFRKIAQLIDPPKSPTTETPPESCNNTRSNSPNEKKLESEFKSLLEEAMNYKQNNAKGKNKQGQLIHSDEGLEKTLASLRNMNPEEFVCDGNYSTLEETLESFNPEEVATVSAVDDASGPIYNYEWVDEVMQALNVSPDISNAFHEIAANINNQDLEQYANFFGLNTICKTKWATPHWPPQHHQITSEGSSPTNENDENIIIQDEGEVGKHDNSNLLMVDQAGYSPQFTVEQLQLLSQLQQQHPLLQMDPQTAQNILMPGPNFTVPPPPIISGHDKASSQSLQLLFQLPPSENQQTQQNHQMMKNLDANQKVQQNVAQTQTTMPVPTGSVQQVLPPVINSQQQGFLNFQLQQNQQNQNQQQAGMQINAPMSQPQKVHQIPQFMNKGNFQQVATQTQMMGTQTQSHPANDVMPMPHTTSKMLNAQQGKKSLGGENKRKDKTRYTFRQAPTGQNQFQYDQQLQYTSIPGSTSTGTTDRSIEIDSETDSNHDTALTLACAGGHEELVELLLSRKANIEHRDKKGFTPLILAATAGHEKVVETLINNGADLEAQSERTKDTPLSLACSGGRYEVVELLLRFGANKEHRNVSDYTPLSLAASGGYVNIIKLLLNHGAEINSRTGSKLGISPLMLAAMNGHTAAVRLLLDMGSDINAQIETNRNTALTLACFQGRHEVVSLLLDRKANVEHRAKTGLTPLMEAASGGYIEVGRVLLDKGADVNAAPVPSSRDTALTIAADKGHLKFVELLLSRGAAVEVKNKKGNSPLWLAANGGHLGVVEALYHAKADIDSQDNRKVSCLMAAFRKGHVKVVKWMVNHVTQFPSDQEMTRYISVVDKEVVDKCHECVKIIRAAKETQAAKANINASILLKELDMEKSREDARKAAAAKRRERKKRRKQEKREAQRKANGETTNDAKNNSNSQKAKNQKQQPDEPDDSEPSEDESNDESNDEEVNIIVPDREEGDSGIDQGSCSSSDAKGATTSKVVQIEPEIQTKNQKNKNRKKNQQEAAKNVAVATAKASSSNRSSSSPVTVAKTAEVSNKNVRDESKKNRDQKRANDSTSIAMPATTSSLGSKQIVSRPSEKENVAPKARENKSYENSRSQNRKSLVFGNSRAAAGADDYEIDYFKATTSVTSTTNTKAKTTSPIKATTNASNSSVQNSASKGQLREEEWKEVGRKPATTTTTAAAPSVSSSATEIGCKKIQVPLNAISRVIGRGGSNINAIRAATGAHIEVEKQGKTQVDRSITIKGVPEATKQAHNLISTLIKDPDADILSMLPRNNFQPVRSSSSTNIISPSSVASINNGTSVWEKSLNTFPTVQNPVKPATYIKSTTPSVSTSAVVKSTTPTQLSASKTQRSAVAKNLFSTSTTNTTGSINSSIMRPTPTTTATILLQNGSKKGIISVSGPPPPASKSSSTIVSNSFKQQTQPTQQQLQQSVISTSQAPSNGSTFASKLSEGNEKKLNQSPTKQISIATSLPAPFTNTIAVSSATTTTSSSSSSASSSQMHQAQPASTPQLTRSITPIGPPARNINASPHSSHIVNTLDLSTPYNNTIGSSSSNDMTSHIQSKLGELHVSAQGLEYSLFDTCKWSQEQSMAFSNPLNPLNVSTPFESEPPVQVDASKAPGYRGTSINSPVSSKTSSNSATPPSTALATQAPTVNSSSVSQSSGTFGDLNVRQGPIQRPNINQSNSSGYGRNAGASGLFEGYPPDNYQSMSFANANPVAMSRLNPKASAFLSNKMNANQYGSSFMGNNSNNNNNNNNNTSNSNFMKSPGSNAAQQNYQRNPANNNPASRWFGDFSLNNGPMDFANAPGSSPSMSPNNNSNINNNANNNMNGPNASMEDSRKAPRPIGTERHNFKYTNYNYPLMGQSGPNLDMDGSGGGVMGVNMGQMNHPPNSWMADKSSQQQWQMQSNVAVIPRNHYENPPAGPDYNMMPDIFQQYPIDQQLGYMRNGGGQTYHPNAYMNDLSNLADLPQQSYEKQQSWGAKWTN